MSTTTKNTYYLAIAACLFLSLPLTAKAGPWLLETSEVHTEEWNYLDPNEWYPVKAIPIFEAAPAGTYVGVGADRIFNLASLSPHINRIVGVDADPQITNFNLMNIFFLRASKNLADYRHLRLSASFNELNERLEVLLTQLPQPVAKTITVENVDRLRQVFAKARGFDALHTADGAGDYNPFAGANYLTNEIQYARLKKMADANRIEAHVVNLKYPSFLNELTQKIANQLSVLDVSNAWGDRYIGQAWIQNILGRLSVRNPNALFVYTAIIPGSWKFDFDYGSVRLKNRAILDRTIYANENTQFGILDQLENSKLSGGSCHGLF